MSEERAQRRLAAILAADIVGYSRLMTIASVMRANVCRDGALREHLIDGLQKAGMPAGAT